jgi:small conductance mechanosensitive channel
MPAAILAADTGGIVGAAIIIVLALGAALVASRLMRRHGVLPDALPDVDLSPQADTRLRFLRRVVVAALILAGITIAIGQFAELHRLAATILASTAVIAAIVGFASQRVLSNAVAGLLIAITQPVRLGDVVTIDDDTGVVEDITLTYTWLRTGSDARLIVPNERLAQSVVRNDSIRSDTVALEVSAWIAPSADVDAALEAVRTCAGVDGVRVAEVADTGAVRLVVAGPPVAPSERIRREGDLRAAVLGALSRAGVPRAGMEAA